jgi:hypothetical protein
LCWSWPQGLSHKEEAEEVAAATAVALLPALVRIVVWGMLRRVQADVQTMD